MTKDYVAFREMNIRDKIDAQRYRKLRAWVEASRENSFQFHQLLGIWKSLDSAVDALPNPDAPT